MRIPQKNPKREYQFLTSNVRQLTSHRERRDHYSVAAQKNLIFEVETYATGEIHRKDISARNFCLSVRESRTENNEIQTNFSLRTHQE
jgi:hypothetical protein